MLAAFAAVCSALAASAPIKLRPASELRAEFLFEQSVSKCRHGL